MRPPEPTASLSLSLKARPKDRLDGSTDTSSNPTDLSPFCKRSMMSLVVMANTTPKRFCLVAAVSNSYTW